MYCIFRQVITRFNPTILQSEIKQLLLRYLLLNIFREFFTFWHHMVAVRTIKTALVVNCQFLTVAAMTSTVVQDVRRAIWYKFTTVLEKPTASIFFYFLISPLLPRFPKDQHFPGKILRSRKFILCEE
jgi:hypothetical protein